MFLLSKNVMFQRLYKIFFNDLQSSQLVKKFFVRMPGCLEFFVSIYNVLYLSLLVYQFSKEYFLLLF